MSILKLGSASRGWTIILAHGAGQPMDSPFMDTMAEKLAARGHAVWRFEFPYMARRRDGGSRGAPDREPVLRDCWTEVYRRCTEQGASRIAIGGKSLGGRIASLVADELQADALICLGYPFHPPGRPERLRTAHLEALHTPTLILQGARDTFGTPDDIAGYTLSPSIRIHWLADGDHGFKPRKSSGFTLEQHLDTAAEAVHDFVSTIRR